MGSFSKDVCVSTLSFKEQYIKVNCLLSIVNLTKDEENDDDYDDECVYFQSIFGIIPSN